MTIYIDILVIINIYVTFFLIKATALFMHLHLSNLRYILGSMLGGLSSLVILLPSLILPLNVLVKCVTGLVIAIVSFGYVDFRSFIRKFFLFMLINLVFAGVMLLLWLFSAPLDMVYNNGVVYFDISFLVITVSTLISYFVIKLVRYIFDLKCAADVKYSVVIVYNRSQVILEGLADSGNSLVDFVTGLPVIICSIAECKAAAPEGIENALSGECTIKGIRILPYSTIGKSGIAVAYKPDKIIISDGKTSKEVNALIGISENNDNKQAIFNPKIIL